MYAIQLPDILKKEKEEYDRKKLSNAQVASGNEACISPLNETCLSDEILDTKPERQ